jgi:hypothetical protein
MTFEEQLEAHYQERRDWYKRTGGPAAALPEVRGPDGEGITEAWPGLTIRDFFAGQALSGEFASQNGEDGLITNCTTDEWMLDRARLIYRMADAMLKAMEE